MQHLPATPAPRCMPHGAGHALRYAPAPPAAAAAGAGGHDRLRCHAAGSSGRAAKGDGGEPLSGPAPVDPTTLTPRWLPDAPDLGAAPARAWSPAALAFIGDSVWELYARRHYFAPARLHATYVAKVSRVTRAETQAAVVAALAAAHLTDAEKALVKWGRNAQTGRIPERLRASGGVYRDATSLEVLVGYLYVSDPPRLDALMRCVGWDDVGAAGAAGGAPEPLADDA